MFTPATRRSFLTQAGCGMGMLGLADLLATHARADNKPQQPHHPAKAKSVIWLYMYGAQWHGYLRLQARTAEA